MDIIGAFYGYNHDILYITQGYLFYITRICNVYITGLS